MQIAMERQKLFYNIQVVSKSYSETSLRANSRVYFSQYPPNGELARRLLVNKGLKHHIRQVISLLKKKRMSYVYHVELPHIFKELEVKTVQFLGGECMFILSQTSPSPSVSHNVRTVFIFSVVSLA